jgi:bacteriocin biosynthesis cyclodehydratase domain-containing protein
MPLPSDDLPKRPRLHRSYYIIDVPNSANILFYREGRGVQLKPVGDSGLLPRLLDLLDGTRTVDDILDRLSDFDSNLVESSIRSLGQAGLLEEGDTGEDWGKTAEDDATRLLISHLAQKRASEALNNLRSAKIVVVGSGEVSTALSRMLIACGASNLQQTSTQDVRRQQMVVTTKGVPTSASPTKTLSLATDAKAAIAEASLVVASVDHPHPDLLDALNEACLDHSVPLFPVVLAGWEGHLGPTCIPGRTACVNCARQRANSNLSRYEEHQLYENAMRQRPGERPFGHLPHFPEVLAGLAATEAFKILTNCYPPSTYGRIVIVDLLMSESESHDVLRVPRCPACGRLDRLADGKPGYRSSPWVPSAVDVSG